MLNYNFKYLLKNSYLTDHSVFVTLNYSKFFLGIRSSFIIFDFNFFFFTFKRVKFFLENLILNFGNIFSLSNAEGSRQDLIFFNSFFFFSEKLFKFGGFSNSFAFKINGLVINKPSVFLIFESEELQWLVNEARVIRVPVIGLIPINSSINSSYIHYPLITPINDLNESFNFYFSLFLKVIFLGYKKRFIGFTNKTFKYLQLFSRLSYEFVNGSFSPLVNPFNKEFVFNDFKKFLLRKKKKFEKNIYNSRRQKFLQKKKKRLGRSFFSRKFFFYKDKRYWASQSNFFLNKNYMGNLGGLKGLGKYTPFEKYFNFFLYKNSSPLFIFQSNLLIKKALNPSLLYYNKDHLNLVKFKSWKFWYYKNSKNLDIVEKNLYKNLNNFINSYKFHRVYTFINNKLNHNLKYFNLTTFFIFYLSSFFIGKKINKKLLVFSYLYFYQNFFKILTIPFNLYRFHSFLSILNKGSFNVLLYKNLNEYLGFRFKKNFTGLYISKLNGFFFYKKVYLPFLNLNKSGIPFSKNFYSLTYLEPFKKNLNLKEESFKFIAPLKLKVYKNFNDFLKFNIGIFSLKLFFYEKNNFKNKKRSKRGPFLRYRKNKKKQFLNNGRQKKKR